MKEQENKKLNKNKNEKGSIVVFVLVAMLFFIMVCLTIYTSYMNKENAQIRQVSKIKGEYTIDNKKMKEEYEEIIWNSDLTVKFFIQETGESFIATSGDKWTNQALMARISGGSESYNIVVKYPDGTTDEFEGSEIQNITKNGTQIEVTDSRTNKKITVTVKRLLDNGVE